MATFTWIISQLDTKLQEGNLIDVVISVHWIRNAEQFVGGESILFSSCAIMNCPTPSSTDFTAYPNLTYDQVCSWLNAGLDVETIDLNLQKQIDNIINPPYINLPLPFNNPIIM